MEKGEVFTMDENCNYVKMFSAIGILSLLYIAIRLVYGIWSYFIIYLTPTKLNFNSFGSWAVVTGSTDGIGKGIAYELAKRKMNILLISRNSEKLKTVSTEIEQKFDVKTKIVALDLSVVDDTTEANYSKIANVVENLDIAVLVNNAGLGANGEFLNAFSKSKDSDIKTGIPKLIYCNDYAMAMVTAMVLPQMQANGKGGIVVNLSSLAASVTMPKHALYSASKRFNDTFTKAMNEEYNGSGILFQSILPGVVSTNMTSNSKTSFLVPSYEEFASHTIDTLGKNVMSAGYYRHGLLHILLTMLPEPLVSRALMKRWFFVLIFTENPQVYLADISAYDAMKNGNSNK